MEYYEQKEIQYFSYSRTDIISLIPPDQQTVLEIGAGGGDTLVEIKKRGLAREVTGIELMHLANTNQTNPAIDKLLFGNVENMDLPFSKEYFDVIICGDVFEHLVDPWAVLEKITPFLKVGGTLITSIPNIRIKYALIKIFFKGDFGYESEGTFDRTHLRFFCKKNMIDLLTTPSLKIEKIKKDLDFKSTKASLANKLTFNLFEEFLALQFLFSVKRIK